MKKQYITALLLVGFLAAGTTSFARSQGAPKEEWTSYSDKPVALKKLPEGYAGMVLVRESNAINGPALNVFVNQKYLTSILPGAYQQAVVCPRDRQEVSLSFISVKNRPHDKMAKGAAYATPTEQNAIFLVKQNQAGQPVLAQIGEAEFKALLPNLKQQTNILSRVDEGGKCDVTQ